MKSLGWFFASLCCKFLYMLSVWHEKNTNLSQTMWRSTFCQIVKNESMRRATAVFRKRFNLSNRCLTECFYYRWFHLHKSFCELIYSCGVLQWPNVSNRQEIVKDQNMIFFMYSCVVPYSRPFSQILATQVELTKKLRSLKPALLPSTTGAALHLLVISTSRLLTLSAGNSCTLAISSKVVAFFSSSM